MTKIIEHLSTLPPAMDVVNRNDALADVRCAAWTSSAEVSPVGSASSCRLFVLIEWPLPWPRDVADIQALAPVTARVRDLGGRVQIVSSVGRSPAADGLREVAVLRAVPTDDGLVGPYVEQSMRSMPSGVVDAALALIAAPELHISANASRRVLVCAHGRRDRCCGSLGTALALDFSRAALGPEVGVWRTSHLGGHRFAPTALLLPDATQWGLLDVDALCRIALRTGSPGELSAHYRGFSGFADADASVIDRFVLGERGWGWLDEPRRSFRTNDGWWRVEAVSGAWQGSVSVRRQVPVPACGQPIAAASKFEHELMLDWATPVSPAENML